MGLRSFRASNGTEARYPRLGELGAASGWGALALGGVLLGGAACTPSHAAPGSGQAPKSSPAPEPHRDGGPPPFTPPMHTAGVPVPQRIDPPAKDTDPTDVPKKDPSAKNTKNAKKGPHEGDKKKDTPRPNNPKPKRTP
jgi:hypothetical protein